MFFWWGDLFVDYAFKFFFLYLCSSGISGRSNVDVYSTHHLYPEVWQDFFNHFLKRCRSLYQLHPWKIFLPWIEKWGLGQTVIPCCFLWSLYPKEICSCFTKEKKNSPKVSSWLLKEMTSNSCNHSDLVFLRSHHILPSRSLSSGSFYMECPFLSLLFISPVFHC